MARAKAPICDHLQPGLDNEAMAAITDPLGLRLPDEARVWWGWHDGVPGIESAAPERHLGPGNFAYTPLTQAAQWYVRMRELAHLTARTVAERNQNDPYVDPERTWPRTRFPLFAPNGYDVVAFECDVAAGAPSPIYYFDLEGGGFTHDAGADSFAQMIGWWREAFAEGHIRYDPAQRVWHEDWAQLPDRVRRSGVV